jgi:hypothetical protein
MPELSHIDPGSAALLVMDYQVDTLTRFMTAAQSADAIACVPPHSVILSLVTGLVPVVSEGSPGPPGFSFDRQTQGGFEKTNAGYKCALQWPRNDTQRPHVQRPAIHILEMAHG